MLVLFLQLLELFLFPGKVRLGACLTPSEAVGFVGLLSVLKAVTSVSVTRLSANLHLVVVHALKIKMIK